MKVILPLTASLLLFASACSDVEKNSVLMTDARRYDPSTLTVRVGDEVTWMNRTSEAHSVTAYQSSLPAGTPYFSSSGASSEKYARAHIGPLMTSEDVFSFRFDQPGTYTYFCIPHEDQGMKGKIVVEG